MVVFLINYRYTNQYLVLTTSLESMLVFKVCGTCISCSLHALHLQTAIIMHLCGLIVIGEVVTITLTFHRGGATEFARAFFRIAEGVFVCV